MLDATDYTPRLKALYASEIRTKMQEEFKYGNVCLLYTSPSPRDS